MHKKIITTVLLLIVVSIVAGCGNINFHGTLEGKITANDSFGDREEINAIELVAEKVDSGDRVPSDEIEITYNEDKTEATYSFSTFALGTGEYIVKKVSVDSVLGDTYEIYPDYEINLEENKNEYKDFRLYSEDIIN